MNTSITTSAVGEQQRLGLDDQGQRVHVGGAEEEVTVPIA